MTPVATREASPVVRLKPEVLSSFAQQSGYGWLAKVPGIAGYLLNERFSSLQEKAQLLSCIDSAPATDWHSRIVKTVLFEYNEGLDTNLYAAVVPGNKRVDSTRLHTIVRWLSGKSGVKLRLSDNRIRGQQSGTMGPYLCADDAKAAACTYFVDSSLADSLLVDSSLNRMVEFPLPGLPNVALTAALSDVLCASAMSMVQHYTKSNREFLENQVMTYAQTGHVRLSERDSELAWLSESVVRAYPRPFMSTEGAYRKALRKEGTLAHAATQMFLHERYIWCPIIDARAP